MILTTLLYCLSCDYFGQHSKRQKKFGDFTSSKNYQLGNLCSVTVQQATYTTPMSNKLNLMLGHHMVPFWSPSYIPSHSDSVSILILNLPFLLLSHDSFLLPLLLIFLILWYELTVVQNMLQETYNWHSALYSYSTYKCHSSVSVCPHNKHLISQYWLSAQHWKYWPLELESNGGKKKTTTYNRVKSFTNL